MPSDTRYTLTHYIILVFINVFNQKRKKCSQLIHKKMFAALKRWFIFIL